MTDLTTSFSHFIGCDVGKREIVVFNSRDGKNSAIPNSKKALAAFAAGLDRTCLVICEATGGYEAALLDAMLDAGIAAHRADARKVKAFIRSFGIRGKTDKIDAKAIAQYGAERASKLALWQKPAQSRQCLQSLVLTRADLVRDRVAYKNRLAAPGAEPVKVMLREVIKCLDRQIATIEAKARALMASQPQLVRDAASLRAIEGVGPTIAMALLALMPELGTLNRRQAAALAGFAPHPNQSGTRDGYRKARGGRPEVKTTLFMGALSATKSRKPMGQFYQRLIAAGKKKKVALVAVMRKIIVIANAKLRKNHEVQLS
jgi:transposase